MIVLRLIAVGSDLDVPIDWQETHPVTMIAVSTKFPAFGLKDSSVNHGIEKITRQERWNSTRKLLCKNRWSQMYIIS